MRIVAGKYRSRKIETRKSDATRPTLDKVREAVFSSLGGKIAGGIFLDLYAGSGANGLEALSRGMDEAYFVDASKEAMDVIQQNIHTLQCEEQTHTYCMKDWKALETFKEQGIKFKIVYLDPPYALQENEKILEYIDQNRMMKDYGLVIIESDAKDSFTKDYPHLHYVDDRKYGITRITYYRYEEE